MRSILEFLINKPITKLSSSIAEIPVDKFLAYLWYGGVKPEKDFKKIYNNINSTGWSVLYNEPLHIKKYCKDSKINLAIDNYIKDFNPEKLHDLYANNLNNYVNILYVSDDLKFPGSSVIRRMAICKIDNIEFVIQSNILFFDILNLIK